MHFVFLSQRLSKTQPCRIVAWNIYRNILFEWGLPFAARLYRNVIPPGHKVKKCTENIINPAKVIIHVHIDSEWDEKAVFQRHVMWVLVNSGLPSPDYRIKLSHHLFLPQIQTQISSNTHTSIHTNIHLCQECYCSVPSSDSINRKWLRSWPTHH